MGSMRIERIGELIKETLGDLLMRIKDPRVGFVTVTRVKVTPDLDSAQVFVSVLGSEEDRNNALQGLQSAAGYLRSQLGKEITLKKTPKLIFRFDPAIEGGVKIVQLIDEAVRSATAPGSTNVTPEEIEKIEQETGISPSSERSENNGNVSVPVVREDEHKVYGKPDYFTREHFEKNKGYAPAYLCELVVYCMELLSQLAAYDIYFRFKGGNSLLLILEEPERFSIDVDIATTESKETLIGVMEDIANNIPVFTKLEIRQHKTKPWLPMISFKLFFESFFQKPEDSYVMLDAVLKPTPYCGYRTAVKVGELYRSNQQVEVPTPSGLIGDKLLTVGPATLGIPIGKGKDAQRLKHVFDISRLSRKGFGIEEILGSVQGCMVQENELQRSNHTLDDVVKDTIRFCRAPQKFDVIPNPEEVKEDPYLYEIVTGFEGFRKHLFKINYTWEMLKEDLKIVESLMESLQKTVSEV